MQLNSKYPIIALSMNPISDMDFAISCAEAGVYPSVSIIPYIKTDFTVNYQQLIDDIVNFKSRIGNTEFMFSCGEYFIHDKKLMSILEAAKIKYIEIILPWQPHDHDRCRERLRDLRRRGFILFQRCVGYDLKAERPARNGYWIDEFDGMMLKGNAGAGAISDQTTEELFFLVKHDYPNKLLIAAGGIRTRADVDFYINSGAFAVGIGTVLAASEESSLSEAAKQKLVSSTYDDVKSNTYETKNALVFKKLGNNGDPNHTISLKIGISRPDIGGHIYAGKAIDDIHSVRSLKEIIKDIMKP